MTRSFTGRHAAAIIIAFFAVVIGVNLLMARLAIGTFGGTVVDNSYVASQAFNGWLASARRQRALGWTVTVSLDQARHPMIVARDRQGLALVEAHARGIARHPLGRLAPVALDFQGGGPGILVAAQPLPPGRWIVEATLTSRGARYALQEAVQ